MTTFYIVRHGQTEWNIKKLLQGHKDSALTELGISQANQQGSKFKNVTFAAAFSSDLLRAKKTAEIIVAERKLEVITSKLLREKSFGRYEGKLTSIFKTELKELSELYEKASDEEKRHFKYPTVETDDETISRFLTFLRETALAFDNQNVLVVSHSGMISNLLIHLGHIIYKEKFMYEINNDCCVVLNSDGVTFEIQGISGIVKNS